MESQKGGASWGIWLVAISLAIIFFYAWSSLRTLPHRTALVASSAKPTKIDISRGALSLAFTDGSPISTRATVRFAASPENVAKGKDVYCATAQCVFVLSEVLSVDVQDRTVKILGDYPGSTSELIYTCHNCSAALGLDVAGIPRISGSRAFSGPGVILTLNVAATALSVECRAQTCATRPKSGASREFTRGATVILPVNSEARFSFSRL